MPGRKPSVHSKKTPSRKLDDFESASKPPLKSKIPPQTAASLAVPPSNIDAEALADMRAYSNLREKRKKAKRKKIITSSIIGVVVLGALVIGGFWMANSMAEDPLEDIPMQTSFVEKGTFLDSVSASGKLKPVSSVSATSEISGLVGEVFVSEGDTVVAGQALYTIVNDDLDKAVAQALQGINEADNNVELAQLAVNDAYRAKSDGIAAADAAAAAPPVEGEEGDGGSGSDAGSFDVAQANSAIRQAELSLESAKTALTDAQVAYNDAVATAEKRTVVAAIDGSVVAVNIEPGSSLGATGGEAAPIQIADLNQMVISIEVNEIDILKIAVDQTATITFSALPDLELQGKVSHIASINTGASDDYGGMGTVTYTVRILIENPDPRLKPGMTGKANVEVQRLDNVLMVPLSALTTFSDTEVSVLVVNPDNPDEFEERMVEILASDGLMAAVKGTLSENEEIVMIGGGGMVFSGDDGMMSSDVVISDTMVG